MSLESCGRKERKREKRAGPRAHRAWEPCGGRAGPGGHGQAWQSGGSGTQSVLPKCSQRAGAASGAGTWVSLVLGALLGGSRSRWQRPQVSPSPSGAGPAGVRRGAPARWPRVPFVSGAAEGPCRGRRPEDPSLHHWSTLIPRTAFDLLVVEFQPRVEPMRPVWPSGAGQPGLRVPGTLRPDRTPPLHVHFLFARNRFANSPESVKVFVF